MNSLNYEKIRCFSYEHPFDDEFNEENGGEQNTILSFNQKEIVNRLESKKK